MLNKENETFNLSLDLTQLLQDFLNQELKKIMINRFYLYRPQLIILNKEKNKNNETLPFDNEKIHTFSKKDKLKTVYTVDDFSKKLFNDFTKNVLSSIDYEETIEIELIKSNNYKNSKLLKILKEYVDELNLELDKGKYSCYQIDNLEKFFLEELELKEGIEINFNNEEMVVKINRWSDKENIHLFIVDKIKSFYDESKKKTLSFKEVYENFEKYCYAFFAVQENDKKDPRFVNKYKD